MKSEVFYYAMLLKNPPDMEMLERKSLAWTTRQLYLQQSHRNSRSDVHNVKSEEPVQIEPEGKLTVSAADGCGSLQLTAPQLDRECYVRSKCSRRLHSVVVNEGRTVLISLNKLPEES
jgi:hypothetical protein